MRELATRKLSRAYHLDEIAASVATMQSASSIEEVARLVLQRNGSDVDAKYVEFFHEKIPSRMLAQSTSLQCLDEIIRIRPADAPVLRTRAVTKIFKEDLLGAAADLTEALAIIRSTETQHKPSQSQTDMLAILGDARELDGIRRAASNNSDAQNDDQPSSLKPQLLFQRAAIYLSLACQSMGSYLHSLKSSDGLTSVAEPPPSTAQPQKKDCSPQTHSQSLEARKATKSYAKRALRDYLSFLRFLEYTPGDPAADTARQCNPSLEKTASDQKQPATNPIARRLENLDQCTPEEGARSHILVPFEQKVAGSQNGHTVPRSRRAPTPSKIFPISDLFAATMPAGLPPYPVASEQVMKVGSRHHPSSATNTQAASAHQEAITFHPLLIESLHSLLLCHSLAQTSPKEHLRHAHMVARLTRICNGYPIFLAARSPSRSDWVEVLRRADNWIGLEQSWESLCVPASQTSESKEHQKEETNAEARERTRQEAIMESLADERVYNDATFQAAVASRERRAETIQENAHLPDGNGKVIKRLTQEDKRDFPVCSDRAEAIAMWVKEAPISTAGAGKSKRRRKKGGLDTEIELSAAEAGS
ncbi:MAG: hypothetical protein Q9208_000910 [Pyrenodesmia sp. 3 TL-2023]